MNIRAAKVKAEAEAEATLGGTCKGANVRLDTPHYTPSASDADKKPNFPLSFDPQRTDRGK